MLHWRPPFQRWPLHHHVLMAGLIVSGVAGVGWWYADQLQTSLITLQREHQSVQGQLDAGMRAGSPPTQPDFTQSLPTSARAEDVVRDMGRFAQSLNMQITSLVIDPHAANVRELGRVQFNMTGQAQYKDTKAWLAELMDRYPTLALQSLSLRAQANDPIRQDIRLTLVLIVQD